MGKKIASRLNEGGIRTVLEMVRSDAAMLRREFSVVLEKTLLELRGTSCVDVNDVRAAKQQILASRSFGTAVTQQAGIVEAVSEFASQAAEKLRQQDSVAAVITVFFTISPYRQHDKQHSVSVTVPLVRPTADTQLQVGTAAAAAAQHIRSRFNYAKAGVMLLDLQPLSQLQEELDLFSQGERGSPTSERDRPALMSVMDELNKRFGHDAVRIGSATLASQGAEVRVWATRQDRRSPAVHALSPMSRELDCLHVAGDIVATS